MINLFRKYQQGLMIAVTFLIIISFVWFYNRTSMEKLANAQDRVATIYGRGISELEIQRYVRKLQLCADLGLFEMLQNLSGTDRQRIYEDFVWNTIVLEHEAGVNQVNPSEAEVSEAVKGLPVFQTQGQFDFQKYANFVQNKLAPRGFTEQQLEEVVRDSLKMRKLKEVIESTIEAAPSELRVAYDTQHQKTKLSLVRLDLAGIASGVQIAEADVQKIFEQRKASLATEEQRKVKFVTFSLPTGEKAPAGKQRIEELQKLARSAEEFSQAMLTNGANFPAVAAKFALPVQETGEFAKSKPDAKLESSPEAVAAAFQLTQKDPNSDPIQTESGFIVMHLEQVIPARPLSFEEAKPRLLEAMKADRARETLGIKGNEIRNKILAGIKAGKSFEEAAKEAGQKVESFPEFSLAELGDLLKQPDSPAIIQKSMEMTLGDVSEMVNTANGGAILHIDQRTAPSDADFQKDKASLAENYSRAKRTIAFREWLRVRREAAKIQGVRS